MDGQRIVYIGDSTTRQLFWATAKKLNATAADEEMRQAGRHEDLTFEDDIVTVEFIWDPFLNSSSLRRELLSYYNDNLQDSGDTSESIGLVTIGGGLWYARQFESDWLDRFRDSLDYAAPLLGVKKGVAPALYKPPTSTRAGTGQHVYVTPVQVPLYDFLSPARALTMTPAKINPMNDLLYNTSVANGIKVAWSHFLMTHEHEFAYEESGLHVVENVASQKVDIILNMRCNAEITLKQGYPFDKTCCSAYENANQSITGLFFVYGIILSLIAGLATFNRTQLFDKTRKHFAYQEFLVLGIAVLASGVFSVRRSTSQRLPDAYFGSKQPVADQPFLSRDQTDEWKGWMQFAILIYHYTGASKILWIYQIVRILVASYLFMTGFGHTVFFCRKHDYSLRRCASVLVRLNLLSCMLPYVMGTDYLFYYFAPLVSFWYVVIYLTMRVSQTYNASVPFLLGKIGASALLVTSLVQSPTLFQQVFLVLERTCQIKWNVKEWRFRLQLDLYIVYAGMLAAIFYIRIFDVLHTQRFPQHHRTDLLQRHWSKIRILSVTAALLVLLAFGIFCQRFPDKYEYNRWVPYISPLPIGSFIILRNSNRYFRNYYASIFAWLGRCSLETFTLQFHIWLAADTKGLLSLGAFGRKPTHIEGRHNDLAVLTVAFLWLSWLTADASSTITDWIVDPKTFYRANHQPVTKLPTTNGPDPQSLSDKLYNRAGCAGAFATVVERVSALWADRLEIRLISIIILMWVLNMLYQ
ncbi:MAG: hypothetical protein Q9181_000457 [Wetmoreana brouardii]